VGIVGGFPFLSVVLVLGTGATAYLGVKGYRRRDTPGARAFSLLAGAMAVYGFTYAVSIPVPSGPLRAMLGATQWFGIALLPVTWLLFALEYSGRPEYLRRPIVVALCVIPALAVGASFASALPVAESSLVRAYGNLFYSSTSSVDWMGHTFIAHEFGPLYLLFIGYAYLCFLTGVGILFEFVARFDHLYQNQAMSIVFGGLFPWIGNVLALLGNEPIPGLDLLPFLVPVSAVLFANAVFRHELFDFTPATRRKGEATLVEEMRDAVVVVDDAERIVNVNAAACETFDLDRGDVLGEPMTDALGISIPEGDARSERPDTADRSERPDTADRSVRPDTADRFEIPNAGDRFEITHETRVFEVTVSPVRDRYDAVIGRTLAFRDITDQRDDQQRLSVLNRVLRHNLRTEVNVISGYASMAARELPETKDDIATEIETAAATLEEIGQKAREVERIMSRTNAGGGEYALQELLESGVERVHAEHPDLPVSIDAPEGVRVSVDAVVFEAVVRDLLDSLAHHTSASTEITLAATVDGDDLVLRVDEPGAGIPKSEYDVVRSGEETPLDHASGLSLWLVKWGARRLDAQISFDGIDGDVELELADCVVTERPPHASEAGASGGDSVTGEPAREGTLADGGDDEGD
jgi:PAS domain S-box-containing protein